MNAAHAAPWFALGLRRAVASLLLATLAFCAAPARAQPHTGRSSDVMTLPDGGDVMAGLDAVRALLPPPPAGFVHRALAEADYTIPRHFDDDLRDLDRARAQSWSRIVEDLGVVPIERVVVRIGRNPEEMRRLAPRGLPPPSYASGVAYPGFGLVLLTLTTHDPEDPVPNLPQVLAHELSHVALHRAAGGRPLPRWFSEGVAVHHSRENNLPRMQVLWEATSQHRLLPLGRIEQGFADGSRDVDVAYAQASDIIAFLLRETHGPDKMRRLLASVRDGKTFEQALQHAFFFSLRDLERAWRRDLDGRHSSIPLVLGGGGLWAVALIALGIGYARKRRKNKTTLDTWANQEAAIDSLEAELARKLAIVEREKAEREAARALGEASAREGVTSDELPSVSENGNRHTLH